MAVRLASLEDMPEVLELIKEFHAETLDAYNLYMNVDVVSVLIKEFYKTSFVLERGGRVVGLLGGQVTAYPGNGEKIYQELVWYVSKKHRLHGIQLYNKLEEYCKENGISKIGMVLMASSKADKLEKFYLRMGFKYLEKHFIKDLRDDPIEGLFETIPKESNAKS